MSKKVRTLLFGKREECETAVQVLNTLEMFSEYDHEYFYINNLEEFDKLLVDLGPTLLVVLADGAEGMECVYRAREHSQDIPVFWFSDDRDFAVQSYRMNCAYFSDKPITSDKALNAFKRCKHTGMQYCVV